MCVRACACAQHLLDSVITGCPSSVLAKMKRRIESGSAVLQGAKRRCDDSSSDEESQLSRQGRYIAVMNHFRQNWSIQLLQLILTFHSFCCLSYKKLSYYLFARIYFICFCCLLWQFLFQHLVCGFFRLEPKWVSQRPGWSQTGIFLQNICWWSRQWSQTALLQFLHVQ